MELPDWVQVHATEMSHPALTLLMALFQDGEEDDGGRMCWTGKVTELVHGWVSEDALAKALKDLQAKAMLAVSTGQAELSGRAGRPAKVLVLSSPLICPQRTEKCMFHRKERSNPEVNAQPRTYAASPPPPTPPPTPDEDFSVLSGVFVLAGVWKQEQAERELKNLTCAAGWLAAWQLMVERQRGEHIENPGGYVKRVMLNYHKTYPRPKPLEEADKAAVLVHFGNQPLPENMVDLTQLRRAT